MRRRPRCPVITPYDALDVPLLCGASSLCRAQHSLVISSGRKLEQNFAQSICRYSESAAFGGTLLLATGLVGIAASRRRSLWLVAVVSAALALATCQLPLFLCMAVNLRMCLFCAHGEPLRPYNMQCSYVFSA